MIELKDYLCGFNLTLKFTAEETVNKANEFLLRANQAGVPDYSPRITSGWRPERYNHLIPGASKTSKHITCQAVDLNDPDGKLGEFALKHPEILEELGLWAEHPSVTKRWLHLQTVPPKSGKRFFYP